MSLKDLDYNYCNAIIWNRSGLFFRRFGLVKVAKKFGGLKSYMNFRDGLTFDDVLLVPKESNILPNEVDTSTKVTNAIALNIPLMSSAMDTVTEEKMAIAMAQAGGLGVIHRNLSIQNQSAAVASVKRFESGVVYNPVTLDPDQTVGDAKKLQSRYKITGFPVADKDRRVLGIVTNRDMRFAKNENSAVRSIMTSENLAVVAEPFTTNDARKLMASRRIEKILVVNQKNELKGLITLKDLEQAILNPNACKDNFGRLRVGAASSVGPVGLERSLSLIESGVDLIVIDTAHGHSSAVLKAVGEIKRFSSRVQILAGNVATANATEALIDAGADSVKVGIGPGSICTTRIVAGVGVPQLTAIMDCRDVATKLRKPIVADGGIKFSGDFAKSIAAGADCAMIGSMLAGTDEAPGEVIFYQGRSYKTYRGMGSIGAMARGSADRYFQQEVQSEKLIPEGVEGQVPYKGPVSNVLYQLVGGLKAAMGYTGNRSIDFMKRNCEFIKLSSAGLNESHVHDVRITKDSPNYKI